MNEPSLFTGESDDGTFVPFTDILFNALLGFTLMLFIAMALIHPDAKTGDINVNAEVLITVTWPDNNPDDIDTYVRDPLGNIVWYNALEKGLMHLDRDDRGNYLDEVVINGKTVAYPLNQESVTLRGLIPGEYTAQCLPLSQPDQAAGAGDGKGRKAQPEAVGDLLRHADPRP